MEKFIEILLLLDNPIFYDSYTNTLIYFKFYKHLILMESFLVTSLNISELLFRTEKYHVLKNWAYTIPDHV